MIYLKMVHLQRNITKTKQNIERVTLPFYKPSQDTTSEHLGLGLNICKILCERHGGTIKISNNHKGGACVTACIKIAYVDEK